MYKSECLGDGLHVHPSDDVGKFDDGDCQGKINDDAACQCERERRTNGLQRLPEQGRASLSY